MRYIFGEKIAEYVRNDKKIYVLTADIGFGVFDKLREENPEHFINCGIAENGMIGMASGMAMEGFLPIVYTITPFLLERPYEAIKLNIVQQKQNVKLISYGDYPDLGPTHITSDLEGLCKCLKLKLYKPQSKEECINMLGEIMESNEPSFMYLSKTK